MCAFDKAAHIEYTNNLAVKENKWSKWTLDSVRIAYSLRKQSRTQTQHRTHTRRHRETWPYNTHTWRCLVLAQRGFVLIISSREFDSDVREHVTDFGAAVHRNEISLGLHRHVNMCRKISKRNMCNHKSFLLASNIFSLIDTQYKCASAVAPISNRNTQNVLTYTHWHILQKATAFDTLYTYI